MEMLPTNSDDSFSVLKKYGTTHMATPPTGNIGFIELPITTLKPPHCPIKDSNTLIQ